MKTPLNEIFLYVLHYCVDASDEFTAVEHVSRFGANGPIHVGVAIFFGKVSQQVGNHGKENQYVNLLLRRS